MREIIINFPAPTYGIKLIDSKELVDFYKSIGKNVPYQYVLMPYVNISETMFVVLPLSKDEDLSQQNMCWSDLGTGWLAYLGKFIIGLGWHLLQKSNK